MLKEIVESNSITDLDLNCAEKILYGANIAYSLNLDPQSLKVAAAFGGGMATESVCGAVSASLMVLGILFVKNVAHESDLIKRLSVEFQERYTKEMGSLNCKVLKDMYRTDDRKCSDIIIKAAELLDSMIEENKDLLV